MPSVRHSIQPRLLRLESLESRQMLAADVELLKDLNPAMASKGHQPYYLTEMNGVIYYSATDSTSGYELWRSDGTAAGTYLLKDLNVGAAGSDPAHLTNIDGTLYFTADVGSFGRELWKSDGTADGAVMVVNAVGDSHVGLFNQGIPTSGPLFTQVGETVFFRAYTGAHGLELWKTDGTAAGTSLVKDVVAGGDGSALGSFVAVGSTLYFTVNDGMQFAELWKSDGTEGGTVRVALPEAESLISVRGLAAFAGDLYFSAFNGAGAELWSVDSTSGAISQVSDLFPGANSSSPIFLTVVGDSLYFHATTPSGDGIWKLTEGQSLQEIRGGLSGGVQSLQAVQNDLYYSSGGDVWRSNGEVGSDVLIASPGGYSYAFQAHGGNVYFFSNEAGFRRLWGASGAPAGAIQLFATAEGGYDRESQLILAESGVVFAGAAIPNDSELWFSDGTLAGTTKLADRLGGVSGNPVEFVRIGDVVYFSAWDGLWKTDGTAEGTVRVKALSMAAQVPMRLSTGYAAAMNGILYFVAWGDGHSDYQLWRSDGTEAGTYVVKTINPTGAAFLVYFHGGSSFQGDTSPYLTVVGDLLYFRATDGVNGLELWRSDGTADGTFMLTNVNASSTKSAFNSGSQHFAPLFTAVENELYFRATNGVSGQGMGLWKTDGTVAGTVRLALAPNNFSYNPAAIAFLGDSVYFTGSLGPLGYGLWKYETASGAVTLIKSVSAQNALVDPIQLRVAGDYLYFTVPLAPSSFFRRQELWRTNGTSDGLVKLFSSTPEIYQNQEFSQFATVGDELYFLRTVYGAAGVQLWRSAGDLENTWLVEESVGSANLRSSEAGPLYFTKYGVPTSSTSIGLYVSDGTADGTILVANKGADSNSFVPTEFVILNHQAIFSANVERYGSELWSVDLPSAPAVAGDFDRNNQVDGADFLRWQRTFGATVNTAGAGADADANRQIDGDDLPAWIDNFGSTPPPTLIAREEQATSLPLAALIESPAPPDEVEDELSEEIATGRSAPLTWFLTLNSLQSLRPTAHAEDPADLVWLNAGDVSSPTPSSPAVPLRIPPQTLTTAAEAPVTKDSAPDEAEPSLSAAWDAAFALF